MANQKQSSSNQKNDSQENSSQSGSSSRKNRGKKNSRRRRFRRRKRSSRGQKDGQKRTSTGSGQDASSQSKKSADGKSSRASRRQRNARARRRRRERRRAQESTPSYSIIDEIEQEYTPPQSVFVYTHTIRPSQVGGYEFRPDNLPAPSRHIEDFHIDLSGIIGTLLDSEAENAGIHLEWNWNNETSEDNADDADEEAATVDTNGNSAQP